jgi:hypothetical protein
MAATGGFTCCALACAGSAHPLGTGTARPALDPLLTTLLPVLATLAAARGPTPLAPLPPPPPRTPTTNQLGRLRLPSRAGRAPAPQQVACDGGALQLLQPLGQLALPQDADLSCEGLQARLQLLTGLLLARSKLLAQLLPGLLLARLQLLAHVLLACFCPSCRRVNADTSQYTGAGAGARMRRAPARRGRRGARREAPAARRCVGVG